MAAIIDEALRVLSNLQQTIDEVSRDLKGDERDAFSARIAAAQNRFEGFVESGSYNECDLSEAANDLIESVIANPGWVGAGEKVSSSEERAALLAQLEKDGRPTRAAHVTHPEKSTVEQYTFQANQIIDKCQIVRRAIDSEPRADTQPSPPAPR